MSQKQEDSYDEELQNSLNELDEDDQGVVNEQGDQADENDEREGVDDDDDEEGHPKKEKDNNEQQEQKRDYYAQFLNPDQEVQANAPLVVVVQGSKESGKSSIIRSLLKHYSKYKVDIIEGTITLRSSKKQRITIIECPNDLCAMIDLSKIADIVLLAIDVSLGFEMETFEFLSLLKCHGFPQVMGVLTHLDFFKENGQLRKTMKKFKKRFEYEVGGSSKLFTLSKWDKGLYPQIQVAKLARYIGNTNPPNVPWRANHPFILADRWQTVEDKSYSAEDTLPVAFYGYVRGGSYRTNGKMHIVGMGDFEINSISVLPDPCPAYKKPQKVESDQQVNEESQEIQEQEVTQKKTGEVKKKKKRRTLNQSERLIYAPQSNLGTLNFDHNSGYVTIPHDYVKFTKMDEENQEQIEEGVQIVRNLQQLKQTMDQKLRDLDNDFELFEGVKVQGDEQQRQINNKTIFGRKQQQIRKLQKQTDEIQLLNPHHQPGTRQDDLAYLIYESKQKMKTQDCSKYHPQGTYSSNLKTLFVTAMDQDVLKQMQDDSDQDNKNKPHQKQIAKILKTNVQKSKMNETTGFYTRGSYVKMVIDKVNFKSFLKMKGDTPVILSRINLGEDNHGFIKVRFKRHRWYSNLLKSNDPIVVSSGWRRYQSLITFATEDPNERMRFLKYTPQHDFCTAVFYGNFNLQNSGCIFSQTIRNDLKKFRIAGSGVILQINKSFDIMKKIKLIGQPYKIMKNTAFIKGMFNSSLEVTNYIGAQVRTVSGIRGQIKKPCKEGGQGTFRATFEDKILQSDLVFCRAWYRVVLQRFCNPIYSFQQNRLMKTKFELRMEKGIQLQQKHDSEYKTIDRAPKTFMPFMVPKKLQAKLPFKTVEKVKQNKKQKMRRAESQSIPKLLMSQKERDVASLIQRLNTIKNMKQQKRQEKFKEKNRIREARERPRKQYYEKLKKDQKSQKMASLTRKKNKANKSQQFDDN